MGIVIVTGVPGVGKSTVMNAAKDFGYSIVNFGTTMFEEAKKEGVKDRDDLRKLPVDVQKRLQKQAGEKIGQMDNIIVDTHASILTSSGYWPGLPEWTVKAIMPNQIVLVEAFPEEIESRLIPLIKKDGESYKRVIMRVPGFGRASKSYNSFIIIALLDDWKDRSESAKK